MKPENNEGIMRPMPENAAEKNSEILDNLFKISLLKAVTINQGNNGLIKKIETDALPPELIDYFEKEQRIELRGKDSLVFKMIKVYTNGVGKNEFETQKKSYELVKDVAEEGNQDEYAKVPHPYIYRELTIDENLKQLLKAEGLDFNQDKIEILVMDFVEGEDFATHLYKEVLRRHKGSVHLKDHLDEMRLDEIIDEVARVLRFEAPGGKSRDEGIRKFEEKIVMNENADKIIKFLEKNGFTLDPSFMTKIRNTINLWHEHGIYHRDLHERNTIVSSKDVYIIDFGESISDGSKKDADNLYQNPLKSKALIKDEFILERYKRLVKSDSGLDKRVSLLTNDLDSLKKIIFEDEQKKNAWDNLFATINADNLDLISDNIALSFFDYYTESYWNTRILVISEYLKTVSDKKKASFLKKIKADNRENLVLVNKLTLLMKN
jgi:hypothetical protein